MLTPVAGSDPEIIGIRLDAAARTARVATSDGTFEFQKLAVSSIAISGSTGAVSLGIDRSTLHVVWQRYDGTRTVNRYGECRKGAPSADGAAATSGAGGTAR